MDADGSLALSIVDDVGLWIVTFADKVDGRAVLDSVDFKGAVGTGADSLTA